MQNKIIIHQQYEEDKLAQTMRSILLLEITSS
jgi:hypothetical protein